MFSGPLSDACIARSHGQRRRVVGCDRRIAGQRPRTGVRLRRGRPYPGGTGKILGIKRPHVSAPMRNRAGSFWVERLMEFQTALGHNLKIAVQSARGGQLRSRWLRGAPIEFHLCINPLRYRMCVCSVRWTRQMLEAISSCACLRRHNLCSSFRRSSL